MFKVGSIVESRVNAQGLIKGQRYRVLSVSVMRTFLGGYASYTVEPLDRTIAAPKNAIGNGHLILSEIE